ncbi:hypothetical protein N665_0195s0001 [Sinapis alba]|nr:hypothetical protein N665_0195s0001 [Sinapis alba]
MSPIRRCSLKGKSIATVSDSTDSESSDSQLVGRPRVIMLGGMDPRPTTCDDFTELNDEEQSVVHFSMELEDREASGHTPLDKASREAENMQATNSGEDADLVDKDKNLTEKETDFRLADFLPMRWTGTNFEFEEEINLDKEQRFSVKKNQKWENHLPMRSSFKSVRKLVLQTSPPAGFSFLIPASHQRPWTPPVGYACVYESCSRQYTANGIRIMVTLTVLDAELGIKMSVRLFEELTTPSITAKTGFFYGKMVPKYNVINGKPSKVNFWNQSYFYVKINEASFEDPSWAQGCSDSFQEQVEAIGTLSHQHPPDISEARIQAALNRIIQAETAVETPSSRTRTQRTGTLNLFSLPSYANSIGTPSHGQEGSSGGGRTAKRRRASNPDEEALNVSPRRSPLPEELVGEHLTNEVGSREWSPERNSPPKPFNETEIVVATEEPTDERLVNPLMESELPEKEPQEDEFQGLDPASHDDEVVEYPHVIEFLYQHTEVPFVGDHEAPARLFRQIKLKKKGMPELDELSQGVRYREMTRAGDIFFRNTNLMVRDYEAKIKAKEEKLAEKTRPLKRKRRRTPNQDGNLMAEKKKAVEMAETEKSWGELLSKELEELKAQKDILDSRLRRLEQEKVEAESKFETATRRLRESQEHELRKERLHVEAALRQHVVHVYEKLVLCSQAKGAREGLEKIQALGMSIDEVLEQLRADENRYSDELNEMEVIEASEINLQPIGLDEHGSNLSVFSPQEIEGLRLFD